MASAVKFKQSNVPRQPSELARLKVTQGPDFGAIYVVLGARSTIGRGEDSDVMIADLKASRRHAEIYVTPEQGWAVRDLGSANGILHNGKVLRAAALKTGDTITMGETTLEFLASDASTMMLVAPPKPVAQAQAQNAALSAQKDRIQSMGGGASSLSKKPSPLIFGALGLAVLIMVMGGDPPAPVRVKKGDNGRALAQYLPQVPLSPATEHTVEQMFRTGFREYTEGHYGRARTQFETVLQIAPAHSMASLYLENCSKAIDKEIKFHLEQGARDIEAGKIKEARAHFEAIQRLLYKDQTNPNFIEARTKLEELDKLLATPEGGTS